MRRRSRSRNPQPDNWRLVNALLVVFVVLSGLSAYLGVVAWLANFIHDLFSGAAV